MQLVTLLKILCKLESLTVTASKAILMNWSRKQSFVKITLRPYVKFQLHTRFETLALCRFKNVFLEPNPVMLLFLKEGNKKLHVNPSLFLFHPLLNKH